MHYRHHARCDHGTGIVSALRACVTVMSCKRRGREVMPVVCRHPFKRFTKICMRELRQVTHICEVRSSRSIACMAEIAKARMAEVATSSEDDGISTTATLSELKLTLVVRCCLSVSNGLPLALPVIGNLTVSPCCPRSLLPSMHVEGNS